ncbi:hypothetical protein [Fischerella sp. JS2]|uniref:hypothetical protein n=1 Tax=Fischerella sp. JS2 TaxID=2597771 RepID=UPI0028E2C4F9|nr:hypothetical protein [Fischerella sp. JS2]
MKAKVATGCAKHANVKAKVAAKKTEVVTSCAKHANVKAKVTARKAEIATGNVKKDHLFSEVHCLTFASDRPEYFPK